MALRGAAPVALRGAAPRWLYGEPPAVALRGAAPVALRGATPRVALRGAAPRWLYGEPPPGGFTGSRPRCAAFCADLWWPIPNRAAYKQVGPALASCAMLAMVSEIPPAAKLDAILAGTLPPGSDQA